MVTAAASLLAIATGAVAWLTNDSSPEKGRSITFALQLQQPDGSVHAASPEEVFRAGDKFRLRVQPGQSGFLYLINQGPGSEGKERYWILHPRSWPAQPADQTVETGWYQFDENAGSERLWLVWAEQRVAPLEEALRTGASGEVQNPDHARKVEAFLARLTRATRTPAAAGRHALQLSSEEATLGHMVELRRQ
jgi:hypothetical protein